VVLHQPKVALAFQRAGQPPSIEPARPMEPEPLDRFMTRLRHYAAGDPTEPGQPRRKARIVVPQIPN
jgi:hypothetical protein